MRKKLTTGFCVMTVFICLCYYIGYDLVTDVKYYIWNKSVEVEQNIYLLETSGKNTMNLRQLASVESIARLVHHDTITVFMFTNRTIEYNAAMLALKSTYGVRFEQSETGPFFKGTPLEVWYHQSGWKKSPFRIVHLSDALRAAIIWTRGGIYLDLDVIMIKDVSFPESFIVWEPGKDLVGNFMIASKKQSDLFNLYMKKFTEKYNPNHPYANGPILFTEVYKMYLELLKNKEMVSDIVELEPEVMATSSSGQAARGYFRESETGSMLKKESNKTLGVHIWNSATKNDIVNATSSCAYIYYVRHSSLCVYLEILKAGEV